MVFLNWVTKMALNSGLNNDRWIRSCFGVKNPKLSAQDRRARTESGVRFKFEDTTFGGSKAINSPAAFTEFADLPVKGITTRNAYTYGNPLWQDIMAAQDEASGAELDQTSSNGMGRTYSEVYSDTGEYVTLRFGLPKQNALLSFFTSFYDSDAAALARTGETPSIFLKATAAVGSVIGMALSPAFLLVKTVSFLVGRPVSKFYYLDPKMHLYWMAANLILNSIMVNAKVIPRLSGYNQSDENIADQWNQVKSYHEQMPDIFRKNGGIDLFGVANRYNRLAMVFHERVSSIAIEATSQGAFVDAIRNFYTNSLNGAITGHTAPEATAYIMRYIEAAEQGLDNISGEDIEKRVLMFTSPEAVAEAEGAAVEEELSAEESNARYNNSLARWSFSSMVADHIKSAFNEGAEFITWRVENTGATQESFSNSTGEAAIGSGFNAMSGSARELRFNAGNFQTGLGPLDSIGSAIGSVIGAAASAVKLEGLKSLLGNAFVDIPDIVTGSSSNMPSMSYTMELRPWSNDPITRVIELHAPIAMALAMVLPISTGKHSYNQPLICEAYSRSRVVCKLGCVTQMSISRGTSNLARNAEGDPLGVTINWTLTDLSKVVHMPVNTDMSAWSKFAQFTGRAIDSGIQGISGGNSRYFQAGAAAITDSRIYDDTNKYTDYMAVLGGLSLQEQIYTGQRLKINMLTSMTNFDTWISASHHINRLGSDTFFGRAFSLLARGTAATN